MKIRTTINRYVLFIMIFIPAVMITLFMILRENRAWIIDEVIFKARDGFEISSFLLRPEDPSGKYPSVACLHQLSGNRDDFLKLFPLFAKKGIIALAPNFTRQRANLSAKRITDLKDALEYLAALPYTEKGKTGIITASFTVETGMYAIQNNPDVIADVIISGPILREDSRKWITRNTDLAVFNIASKIDGNHYLLMKEYAARSLNPLSRNLFIEKKEAPFGLPAHGTFVFDEFPEVMDQIAGFFSEVFGIRKEAGGEIVNPVPCGMITFNSTDNMPINATFKKPEGKSGVPAILLYPPESETRLYFDKLTESLVEKGIAVLAPNTKRACRKKTKINLCDMEVNGALRFLKNDRDIDPEKIAVLFSPFYHLYAEKAVNGNELPVGLVFLMDFERFREDIRTSDLIGEKSPVVRFIDGPDPSRIYFYIKKYLEQ